mmetsp:Transcript_70771/g.183672  ORF Transcript_70771/g.183672 Transcript_70771/m.183672 type:complete len:347 (-) Transcript_70771:21-1061(-)
MLISPVLAQPRALFVQLDHLAGHLQPELAWAMLPDLAESTRKLALRSAFVRGIASSTESTCEVHASSRCLRRVITDLRCRRLRLFQELDRPPKVRARTQLHGRLLGRGGRTFTGSVMHRLLVLVHHLHTALLCVQQHESQLRTGHGDELCVAEAARKAEHAVPRMRGLTPAAQSPLQRGGPRQGMEPRRVVASRLGSVCGVGEHAEDQHVVDLLLPGEAVRHAEHNDGLLPRLVEFLRSLRSSVEGVEGSLEIAGGVEPLGEAALLRQSACHTGLRAVLLEFLHQAVRRRGGVGHVRLAYLSAEKIMHVRENDRKACHSFPATVRPATSRDKAQVPSLSHRVEGCR